MPEILDNQETHALILRDDGTTETVTWNARNTLIYKHGLSDLLVERSELVVIEGESDTTVEVSPFGGDGSFTIHIERGDFSDSAPVPEHRMDELLRALRDVYEGDRDPRPLVRLAGDILDYTVDPGRVQSLVAIEPFDDAVEVRDDGWYIYDHLLLTYNNEFYHPDSKGRDRSGNVVSEGANKRAYELQFQSDHDAGQSSLGSFGGLGSDEDTVEFLARALWAITYAPQEEP